MSFKANFERGLAAAKTVGHTGQRARDFAQGWARDPKCRYGRKAHDRAMNPQFHRGRR